MTIERKKFTYWLTEVLWSLIFRHYFDFKPSKMNRRSSVDYRRASHSLIRWVKRKIPGCQVNDLFFDLRDGIALCGLINSIVPNTIDECMYSNNDDAEDVVSCAMRAAKEVLGIPYLITPEELVDCNVDEKSIITYIALYRSADRMLSRGIRPVSPRLELTRDELLENGDITPSTTDRISSRGIKPAAPRLELNSDASIENVDISRGIKRVSPRADLKHDAVLDTMNGTGKPSRHTFRQVPEKRQSTEKQNIAYGFGIHYGEVGKPTEFIVHLTGSYKGDLSVFINCVPDDERPVYLKAKPKIKSLGDSSSGTSYIVSYTPIRSGEYQISVLCGEKHIYNSPFSINIQEPVVTFECLSESDHKLSIEPVTHLPDSDYLLFSDDSGSLDLSPCVEKIEDKIRRLSDRTNKDDEQDFKLNSDRLTDSDDSVFIEDPFTRLYLDQNSKGLNSSTHTSGYSTSESSSKKNAGSSASHDIEYCTAIGEGLYSGEVGVVSHFEVRTPNSGCGPLSVVVTCPAMSIPSPHVNTRSSGDVLIHDVMYLPTEPGYYAIEIKWGKKIVADSPYHLAVKEIGHSLKQIPSDLADLFDANEMSAVIFYSATSSDKKHQRRKEYLESIMSGLIAQLHTKCVPVDIALSAGQRRNLFAVAQDRTLPLVFVNRKFIGGYDAVIGLDRQGMLEEHVNEVLGDALLFHGSVSDFIDVQVLNDIKNTLHELKHPLSNSTVKMLSRSQGSSPMRSSAL